MKKREIVLLVLFLLLGLTSGFYLRSIYRIGFKADTNLITKQVFQIRGLVDKEQEQYKLFDEKNQKTYILLSASPSLNLEYAVGNQARISGYLEVGNYFVVNSIVIDKAD